MLNEKKHHSMKSIDWQVRDPDPRPPTPFELSLLPVAHQLPEIERCGRAVTIPEKMLVLKDAFPGCRFSVLVKADLSNIELQSLNQPPAGLPQLSERGC